MAPIDLLHECERATRQGLKWLTLTIPMRRVRGRRVRVMPGVLGDVIGSTSDRLIVSVTIVDVVWALEQVMIPAAASSIPPDLPSGPTAHDGDEPDPDHYGGTDGAARS